MKTQEPYRTDPTWTCIATCQECGLVIREIKGINDYRRRQIEKNPNDFGTCLQKSHRSVFCEFQKEMKL